MCGCGCYALKFFYKAFSYSMGKALSGKLSCSWTDLVEFGQVHYFEKKKKKRIDEKIMQLFKEP